MKVHELIATLQSLEQDANVIVTSSNFELNYAIVEASFVHQYNNAQKFGKNITDAFDGIIYQKEVWKIHGGNEKVVCIS